MCPLSYLSSLGLTQSRSLTGLICIVSEVMGEAKKDLCLAIAPLSSYYTISKKYLANSTQTLVARLRWLAMWCYADDFCFYSGFQNSRNLKIPKSR